VAGASRRRWRILLAAVAVIVLVGAIALVGPCGPPHPSHRVIELAGAASSLCAEQQPSADNCRRDVHDAAAGHLPCRRGHRNAQPAQCADDDRLQDYQTYRPMVNNSGYAADIRRPGRSR
jgi:hypothetical protein